MDNIDRRSSCHDQASGAEHMYSRRYEQQWAAVDNSTCGGGLRWAKSFSGTGWDQKTAITNFGFINVAARLGKSELQAADSLAWRLY